MAVVESKLVTVKALNTVWSDGVIPLYKHLDDRLNNIGQVYTFQKVYTSWSLSDNDKFPRGVSSPKKGDVYLVNTGYPLWTKDPESFPSYTADAPPRMYICTKGYSGQKTFSNDEASEEYWSPLDLNLQVATNQKYGLIKVGEAGDSETETDRLVKLNSNDIAHVELPTATKHHIDSNDNTEVLGTVGLVAVGDGIGLNGNNEIYIEVASGGDSGLEITDAGELSNTGVKSLKYETATDTYTILKGNIIASTPSGNNGEINFSDGSNNFSAQVSGWASKQNASTAIRTTKADGTSSTSTTEGIGSTSRPVFINNENVPKQITRLVLGDSSNAYTSCIARFETGTITSANTVEIKGQGHNNDSDPASQTYNALKVDGRALISGALSAKKVYHAVWNDITDAIEVQDTLNPEPGCCYYFNGDKYYKTDKYCQNGIIGIHSDTAGDILGRKGKHKELDISIGGFVLAYVDKIYKQGTPLTATKDGKLTKMRLISRILHPERLVATYWKPEAEKEWGDENHKVQVNGRTWVKVR